MLHSIQQRYGEKLRATDGEIGHVRDFYFDDKNWAVRYLVADTGRWLSGRLVLISPHALGHLYPKGKVLLVNLTREQIEKMIRINKTRADYLAKFEELIESYNAGSRSIDELFQELVALSRRLTEEQQRHVREQLTEDELTVFDILTRPGPDLTPDERDEVKKVARQLLEKLKSLLVLEWRQKAQARAQVRLAIEDVLDDGLPRAYSRELYKQKCSALFEHVFENSAQLEARVA
jgi:restriction endonuclease HindI-like protein/PRC-barrel domain protein